MQSKNPGSWQQPTPSSKNTKNKPAPSFSWEDRKELTKALAITFSLQRQYGKSPQELENLVEGFCWILRDFTMQQILESIAEFISKNPEIPTPSDLLKILRPTGSKANVRTI